MVFTDDSNEQSANKQVGAVYTLAAASGIFASLQQLIKREGCKSAFLAAGDSCKKVRIRKDICMRAIRKQVCIYISIDVLVYRITEREESVTYFLKI